MTIVNGSPRAGLVARVQGILLRPTAEWNVIDSEPATIQGLFTGYACILAAIPAVCSFIGMQVFGVGFFGVTYHPPLISSLVNAILTYVLTLVGAFVVGLIIDALAPSFGGTKNQVQAMKAIIYANTAAWVAGVFNLIPMLGLLAIIGGLYSLFLLFKGIPKMMKAPEDKALGYTAVTIVCAIVVYIVIGAVVAAVAGVGAASLGPRVTTVGSGGTLSGTVAGVDLGKLQAASKQMEASAAVMQAQAAAAQAGAAANAGSVTVKGGTVGIDPNVLKGLLPGGVNGFNRTEVSAESAGAAGLGTSHAEGHYAKGDATMTVEVTDTGAMAGLAGMASAFNVNTNKETETGYEKVSTVDGRMTTEEYDRTSKHGKFGVLAGGRFMVEADGNNVTMDDLKAAVNAVGVPRVEQLAKR